MPAESGAATTAIKFHAVFVVGSIDPNPVALFAYPGDALKWAERQYPGRYRVSPVEVPTKLQGAPEA